MAKKSKGNHTLVDRLTGEVEFTVSGGKVGKPGYITPTKGFKIRVVYKSESEIMIEALNSTRIAVQSKCRQFYRKHGRFPFLPGKTQLVDGSGDFTLPEVVSPEKTARAIMAEPNMLTQLRLRIEMAEGIQLPVPEEWRAELASLEKAQADSLKQSKRPYVDYSEETLMKHPTGKLRSLAQDAEIVGYDDLSREELIVALALLAEEPEEVDEDEEDEEDEEENEDE